MCLDCGCLEPENDHGDPDAHITLGDLQDAADASGVTVDQAAANIVMTLAFKGDGNDGAAVKTDLAAMHVLKAEAERRYTLGLAYPALVAPGMGADGYNDFISKEALETAAWNWMRNRQEIGLFHQDGLEGHAQVVESYIFRGPDWTVTSPVDGSEVTIKSGDWMLGTIWDEHGWELVKAGLVRGWSPEGGARRRVSSADQLARLRP